jgi:hypothetical protein
MSGHTEEQVEAIRAFARGKTYCSLDDVFEFIETRFNVKWSRTDATTITYIKSLYKD